MKSLLLVFLCINIFAGSLAEANNYESYYTCNFQANGEQALSPVWTVTLFTKEDGASVFQNGLTIDNRDAQIDLRTCLGPEGWHDGSVYACNAEIFHAKFSIKNDVMLASAQSVKYSASNFLGFSKILSPAKNIRLYYKCTTRKKISKRISVPPRTRVIVVTGDRPIKTADLKRLARPAYLSQLKYQRDYYSKRYSILVELAESAVSLQNRLLYDQDYAQAILVLEKIKQINAQLYADDPSRLPQQFQQFPAFSANKEKLVYNKKQDD